MHDIVEGDLRFTRQFGVGLRAPLSWLKEFAAIPASLSAT